MTPGPIEKAILALDPGLLTGYAVRMGSAIMSGVWDLHGTRFEGAGMRFLRLRSHLESVEGISAIYFEEVHRHLGTAAAHCYGGMVATIMAFCEDKKIPYSGVPVQTVKKHATGKGNANKDRMVVSARMRWPDQFVENDDQADALWILDYAETHFKPGDTFRATAG
jgi:Holliday junction resolvasome RuvABC endonuclease subunit